MNILIHIDPSWSYRFFEFNKPAIGKIDFMEFMDRFYSSAMLYLQTQANYPYNKCQAGYHSAISQAMALCNTYPELASKITQAFIDLHQTHRPSLGALQGPITKIQTVCDDTGILTAIVVTIEIRSVLTPILQS